MKRSAIFQTSNIGGNYGRGGKKKRPASWQQYGDVFKYPNATAPMNQGSGSPKDRPAVNLENVHYGSFFVDPKALAVYKKYMEETCQKIRDVNLLAEEQARFQYYYVLKNFAFAKKYSKKKPPECRVGRSFNCNACDEFFYTKMEIDQHRGTNTHSDVMLLYNHFRRIGDEWFSKMTKPDYVLPEWVLKAETEGMKCETKTPTEVGDNSAGSSTPLTDDIFIGIDLSLSEDDFVLATYDNIMEIHWPKPSTNHFCRCCNHVSFDTEEELQEHLKSTKHKEFETNYDTSWCVSCQRHAGSAEQLEIHNNSSRHKMIRQLLADTRVRALKYFKREQAKLKKGPGCDDNIVPVGGFMCKICDVKLNSSEEVEQHKLTQSHTDNVNAGGKGAPRNQVTNEPRRNSVDLSGKGGAGEVRRPPPPLLAQFSWRRNQFDSATKRDLRGSGEPSGFSPYPPRRAAEEYKDDTYYDDYYGYASFEDYGHHDPHKRYPLMGHPVRPPRPLLDLDFHDPSYGSPFQPPPPPPYMRQRLLPTADFKERGGLLLARGRR